MNTIFKTSGLAVVICILFSGMAYGFGEMVGACEPDCTKCHKITKSEASTIVKGINPDIEILDVKLGPVGGLWELVVAAKGRKGLAYLDFSKKHIITGSVIDISTRDNLTDRRLYDLSRIDPSAIPLEDAIVMGDEAARYKVIVFDDPDCAFCRKLHRELKGVLEKRDDVVFYIKLLPLKIHPDSYKKAKTIICEKSLKMLESAFDGRSVPEPSCETVALDDTIELAERLGITGTPTVVLPDGAVVQGFKDSQTLMNMIDAAGANIAVERPPKEEPDTPEAMEPAQEELKPQLHP